MTRALASGTEADPQAIVVLDLDRTLVFAPRWFEEFECAADRHPVEPGRPAGSALHRAAVPVVAELLRRRQLVPCTARSLAQYRRLDGGWPGPAPHLALVANGGHLIVDGVPDASWHAARVAEIEAEVDLDAVTAVLATFGPASVVDDVLVTGRVDDPGAARTAAAALAETRWVERLVIVVERSHVMAVPNLLSKGRATARLAGERRLHVVMAAGDGPLDSSLLEVADRGIVPAHAESCLLDQGWPRTRSVGPEAGADVAREGLRWLESSRSFSSAPS